MDALPVALASYWVFTNVYCGWFWRKFVVFVNVSVLWDVGPMECWLANGTVRLLS